MSEEIIHGPVSLIMGDGKRFTTETRISRTDDWQDTPIGPVNFGRVTIGPSRVVKAADENHPVMKRNREFSAHLMKIWGPKLKRFYEVNH